MATIIEQTEGVTVSEDDKERWRPALRTDLAVLAAEVAAFFARRNCH
jgi:hypothetical protein